MWRFEKLKEQWVGMGRRVYQKAIWWNSLSYRISPWSSSLQSPTMNMELVLNKGWMVNYTLRLKKLLEGELDHTLFSQFSYFWSPLKLQILGVPDLFPETLTSLSGSKNLLMESSITLCFLNSPTLDPLWSSKSLVSYIFP
jgi:hypothetical protein